VQTIYEIFGPYHLADLDADGKLILKLSCRKRYEGLRIGWTKEKMGREGGGGVNRIRLTQGRNE